MRSWRHVLAIAGVAWALLAAGSALRAARAMPPDPMGELESEFGALAIDLPARGEIGYLEQWNGGGSVDAVRMHYAAQYALAPRIIVGRTGPEFVIVARGTEKPDGEPRLRGYAQVAKSPAGHRVFRRLTE